MVNFLDIGAVILGFALLIIGGDLLVKIAIRFAVRFHLPPAAIGLTIVAAGTSLPEMVTSILAALQGNADISVGNVVGSNTFNILAGIGLASMIRPNKVLSQALKIEWPFLFVTSIAMFLMALNHVFESHEGGFMVLALVAFMWFSIRNAKKIGLDVDEDEIPSEVDNKIGKDLILLSGGVIALIVGAEFALTGAINLGRAFGISDRVLGLTIISAGTGLPELATSAMAAFRGRNDIAFANILGSNIMNILGILGTTAIITPLSVSPTLIDYDMIVMLGATILLFPFMIKSSRLIRQWEGALMFACYLYYLYSLI